MVFDAEKKTRRKRIVDRDDPFGPALQAALDYFDVKQGQLGAAMGRDTQYISRIINRRDIPTTEERAQIAAAFATIATPPQPQAADPEQFFRLAQACETMMEERKANFGDALHAFRQLPSLTSEGRKKPISQREAADFIGGSSLHIYKYEKDEQVPTSSVTRMLIDRLEAANNTEFTPVGKDFPEGAARERGFYAAADVAYLRYEGKLTTPEKSTPAPENIRFGNRLRIIREELDEIDMHRNDNPGSQRSISIAAGYPTRLTVANQVETGFMALPEKNRQMLFSHLGLASQEAFEKLADDVATVRAYRQKHFPTAVGKVGGEERGYGKLDDFAEQRGLAAHHFAPSYHQRHDHPSPPIIRRIVAAMERDGIHSEADIYRTAGLSDIPTDALARVEAFTTAFRERHLSGAQPQQGEAPDGQTATDLAPSPQAGNYSASGPRGRFGGSAPSGSRLR